MPKPLFAIATLALLSFQTVSLAQAVNTPKPRQPRLFSQTNIDLGWKAATRAQQPLLVMFTSDNCIYCKKMLATTYRHPAIEQMLAGNTQTVLAHANDYRPLVKRLGIRGFPSSLLISPQGKVLDVLHGYVPPQDFAQRISPLLKAQAQQARAKPTQQTVGR